MSDLHPENARRRSVIPAVFVILRKADKVLLLRRAGGIWRSGWFVTPTGHLEGGESIKSAAAREAKEEVGVDIDSSDLELVYVNHKPSEENDGSERMAFFFVASKWHGEPTNCEPDKCDLVDWFSLDSLPEKVTPDVKDALENYEDSNFREWGFDGANY